LLIKELEFWRSLRRIELLAAPIQSAQ
jgi:hypothetical protein